MPDSEPHGTWACKKCQARGMTSNLKHCTVCGARRETSQARNARRKRARQRRNWRHIAP